MGLDFILFNNIFNEGRREIFHYIMIYLMKGDMRYDISYQWLFLCV